MATPNADDLTTMVEEAVDPTLDLEAEIARLKTDRRAVILAHVYQEDDVQDIADATGDSLILAQKAAETDAEVILFCGVHFMAEVAKVLNPGKVVLLPDTNAGCSLADRVPVEAFRAWRAQHPDHAMVTYINSSLEVKAMSDIICTSSNADRVVASFPKDRPIAFAPDRHLGAWVQKQTGREMALWPGSCVVHEQFNARHIHRLRQDHPKAKLAAHPECDAGVLDQADFIGSTAKIIDFVSTDPATAFIIATEIGVIHQIRKRRPDVEVIPAPPNSGCACAICPYMRLNTLEKVYLALKHLRPQIEVDLDLAARAKQAIDAMLALG